jgi:carbamoyl-phosphate synthase small subunit
MVARARDWKGLVGLDLAKDVTTRQSYRWDEGLWAWPGEFTQPRGAALARGGAGLRRQAQHPALAGAKRREVTVLPATATAEDVLAHNPEGVFLSNGPGDPAATGAYAVPMIQGCWPATCRSSASALATRCWRWRLGPRPSR